MELELALGLPSHVGFERGNSRKRDSSCGGESLLDLNCTCEFESSSHGFSYSQRNATREAMDDEACSEARTLPLVCEDGSTRSQIVGWPPVKSCMNSPPEEAVCSSWVEPREEESSTYVKVNMEGVAIGRKVDLNIHQGYHTLLNTLADMFGEEQRCRKQQMNGVGWKSTYTLTYKDGEGDWLLVGDVPWDIFVRSAKRLKIRRNGF
ncbi:auxin-responsive protein IAA31-like isoform X2 [Nymphaea colorata]|nr:auxin-responsive protein IAA31-like isoform X2 [Nymphaea colorata]